MTAIIGRGVRVEIGSTEGTAVSVSAVTLANPGVATSTSHGLATKSVGYFKDSGTGALTTGMTQLTGQAVRLGAVATNTFALEDIETTNYTAWSGTADFVPITAWSTVTPVASYSIGGGEADPLDTTVLLDDIRQLENGLLAAQVVTLGLKPETVSGTAMAAIRRAARNNSALVWRITLKTGDVRVFRGTPSLPGEDVQQGQVGTGQITVTVKRFVTEGAA